MRYPFVLFDAGETLLTPRDSFAVVYSRVLATMGLVRPADLFEEALRSSWEEMSRVVPKGTDRYGYFPGGEAEYWLRFVRSAIERVGGAPLSHGFAEEARERLRDTFRLRDSWQLFPDVVPVLQSLKAVGARLAVVSNWDSRLPDLLEELGLASHFDAIVVSHHIGVEKPNPGIFRRALELLKAEASSTLHVGDVPELDIAGAESAGIDAVLVDRRDRHATFPGRLPDLAPLPQLAREGLPRRLGPIREKHPSR